MSDCYHLSDRIPDVLRGLDAWSREDDAHLRACPDCRAELDLVRTAMALGSTSPVAEPARVASQALQRLRNASPRRRAIPLRRIGWALAAAAALVLGVRLVAPAPAAPEPGITTVLHELDGLDEAELERLLSRVTDPAGPDALRTESLDGWGDLTDAEWQALLSTLEG